MNKAWLLLCVVMLLANVGSAQPGNFHCERAKRQPSAAKASVANPQEDLYDVHYVKLDLSMSNMVTTIAGSATINAAATQNMLSLVFELSSAYQIDSAFFNGSAVTVSNAGDMRTISLGSAVNSGQAFSVKIAYHGTYTNATGIFNGGPLNGRSSWGNKVTYTQSEPYTAKDWWPCKQALLDKIDSSDVWITVADSLKAGSNGRLVNVTTMPGNQKRYEWRSRYPIDYYLISATVANYMDYSYYMHFSGSTDSMLIQNFIYNDPAVLTRFKSRIDSVALMINYFSGLFGRYPFWKEKYGHCMAPLGGGEEHQTMTTITNFDDYYGLVTPHELGHQWWGDQVTCGTWQDIWLNEGFASYCENLFSEHFRGMAAADTLMSMKHYDPNNGVTATLGGSTYVDDTTVEARIFSNSLTYYKGASVVHMLRYLAANDSTFFAALRVYQQKYAFGNATTDSFRNAIQPFYSIRLDTFFKEWIYGQGFPVYTATWNQVGGNTFVRLVQQPSFPSVTPKFHLPVEVGFSGPAGDTIVRVWMSDLSNTMSFAWSKPITSVTVDPADWIPHYTISVSQDPKLFVGGVMNAAFSVMPNPSHTQWHINGMHTGTWKLLDMAGRLLAQGPVSDPVEAGNLLPGVYLLQVANDAGKVGVSRLVRD